MSEPPAPKAAAVRHPLPPELLHELRTPLTQIIGYSEMLAEQAAEAGHAGYLADLAKVSAAGYRLLALFEESFQAVRPLAAPAEGPACLLDPDEGPDAAR
jgi:signal transduction histidine kinase